MESEVRDSPTCKNCGTPLTGEYCAKCGQRDYDFNKSFGELGAELAESFFNWDTKLVRAVFDLIFRPGMLTKAFLAGKRASQVPPLRFYLFVSIIYFLASSFAPGKAVQIDDPDTKLDVATMPLDDQSKLAVLDAKKEVEAARRRNPDSFEVRINDLFRERMGRLDEIKKLITANIPNLVFALLPVFALITRLIFRRARLGYLSHLVMALHLHTFFFLFDMTTKGWAGLAGYAGNWLGELIRFAAGIYFIIYAFVAARRVFGCSAWGTIWRGAVTAIVYSFCFGVGFATFVIAIFLTA